MASRPSRVGTRESVDLRLVVHVSGLDTWAEARWFTRKVRLRHAGRGTRWLICWLMVCGSGSHGNGPSVLGQLVGTLRPSLA